MNLQSPNKPPANKPPSHDTSANGPEAPETLGRLLTADDYAEAAHRRSRQFLIGGILLAVLVAVAFAGIGKDSILVPLVALVALLVPLLLWRFPRLVLYFTLTAVCLFELSLIVTPDNKIFPDALTDRVPIFWNVNTIFQLYANTNFKGVPLNLFEVFIVVAGVCSCLRAVYTGTADMRGGPLLIPVGVFLGFVLMGWLNGMMTGGDFKISLQEVRPEFYFALAYLLGVNIVRERKNVEAMLWITVVCIGIKGILLTFRRYVTLHNLPIPDQGVGAHEEAFMMNAFILLLACLSICKVLPRLRRVMWILAPFVVMADLMLNRRAATAAMIIVVPILMMAAYQALPDRRRMIMIVSVITIVAGSIYYPLFRNSETAFAQPARAIKSNFEPDFRDAQSNASRDDENADLMATIRTAPVQGYGYGRPFLQNIPMTDVTKLYSLEPYIPHNQILWVWERVGSFGFAAFWVMIGAIIIRAGQTIRAPDASDLTKAVGIFIMLITAMLVLFGLLDLQLSNFRDVLFAGLWAGTLGVLPTLRNASVPRARRAVR